MKALLAAALISAAIVPARADVVPVVRCEEVIPYVDELREPYLRLAPAAQSDPNRQGSYQHYLEELNRLGELEKSMMRVCRD
jgi:hypothetical protein